MNMMRLCHQVLCRKLESAHNGLSATLGRIVRDAEG